MDELGGSASGWSEVGVGFAGSLATVVDERMQDVTQGMTDAILVLSSVQSHMDDIGDIASGLLNDEDVDDDLRHELAPVAKKLREDLPKLFGYVKPVLEQIQKWLVAFGEKLMKAMESFSIGFEVAQKVLDQITQQLTATGTNADEMRNQTYNLFDVSNTGFVTVQDLKDVSILYSITALQGKKAHELFEKYDANEDKQLDTEEFGLLVDDDSLPGAMAVVLRSYAKKLSVIAGQVAAARMRDEVAEAVSSYLSLVCAKNLTKVGWVAVALSNGSLPLPFTADVMAQLALDSDRPGKLTTADVGGLVIEKMVQHSSEHVAEAMELLVDASFWEDEGFDPEHQAHVVKKVGEWIHAAKKSEQDESLFLNRFGVRRELWLNSSAHSAVQLHGAGGEADLGSFLQGFSNRQARTIVATECVTNEGDCVEDAAFLQDVVRRRSTLTMSPAATLPHPPAAEKMEDHDNEEERDWPRVCENVAILSQQQHERAKHVARAERLAARMEASNIALSARTSLRSFISLQEPDPEAEMAMRSGQKAKPETLKFAQWLANNESNTAHLRLEMAFVYSAQSSGAADSVAQVFSKMVKRFQSFLHIQEKYASPRAIERLENFVSHTVNFLNHYLTEVIDEPDVAEDVLLNTTKMLMEQLSKVFDKAEPALDSFRRSLPTAISSLKKARKEVSAVAKVLDSGFTILGAKAPPVFTISSEMYSVMWICYFVFFILLTFGMLFFALYASGYIGKSLPADEAVENYEPPQGSANLLRACLASCCSCLTMCDDYQICFWSCILLVQVFWLVMFVASFMLLLVMGLKAFIAAGCAPVYMLGDVTVCSQALQLVSSWLEGNDWLGSVSQDSPDSLLVCHIVSQKFGKGILMSALSNVLAATLTFLMIVDSAMMHERKRCHLMYSQKA